MPKFLKLTYLIALMGLSTTQAFAQTFSGIQSEVLSLFGKTVNVISVDSRNPSIQIRPFLIPRDKTFRGATRDPKLLAAVNGCYFSDYVTFTPIGYLVIDGKRVSKRYLGSGIGFLPDGSVDFRSVFNEKTNFESIYNHFLTAGPRLIENGQLLVELRKEGFSDPHLDKPNRRTAVGKSGSIFYMVATMERFSLSEWAMALRQIGLDEAINLDGGSSTGIFCRDSLMLDPRSHIPVGLGIFSAEDTAG